MTQGERVKELRKELGLTLEKFGERIGVQKASISKIENGTNGLSELMVKSICREFNVDYLWLTTGEGEMFIESDDYLLGYIDNLLSGEQENIKRVLRNMAYMSTDDLEKLNELIGKLVDKE